MWCGRTLPSGNLEWRYPQSNGLLSFVWRVLYVRKLFSCCSSTSDFVRCLITLACLPFLAWTTASGHQHYHNIPFSSIAYTIKSSVDDDVGCHAWKMFMHWSLRHLLCGLISLSYYSTRMFIVVFVINGHTPWWNQYSIHMHMLLVILHHFHLWAAVCFQVVGELGDPYSCTLQVGSNPRILVGFSGDSFLGDPNIPLVVYHYTSF